VIPLTTTAHDQLKRRWRHIGRTSPALNVNEARPASVLFWRSIIAPAAVFGHLVDELIEGGLWSVFVGEPGQPVLPSPFADLAADSDKHIRIVGQPHS
jgi:hypothetical protein